MKNIAGQWEFGQRHGRGVESYSNGEKYVGPWENNKKHGHFRYTTLNGFKEGIFEKGVNKEWLKTKSY